MRVMHRLQAWLRGISPVYARLAFQAFAKVGVGDRNNRARPLGHRLALQVDDAVVGHHVHQVAREVVTTLPDVRFSTMLLLRTPRRSQVNHRHVNDLPPVGAYAARTNCACPPVLLMWR